jgi:hypothetical protein
LLEAICVLLDGCAALFVPGVVAVSVLDTFSCGSLPVAVLSLLSPEKSVLLSPSPVIASDMLSPDSSPEAFSPELTDCGFPPHEVGKISTASTNKKQKNFCIFIPSFPRGCAIFAKGDNIITFAGLDKM